MADTLPVPDVPAVAKAGQNAEVIRLASSATELKHGRPMGPGPVGFDLDMTLIDSRPAILASFAELPRDTSTPIHLVAGDSRVGIKLEDELVFWYPPDQRAAAAVTYRRHYVRLAEQMTTAMPGA